MQYASVDQMRSYFSQIPSGAENDGKLMEVLDRATAIVDDALGFSFALFPAAATARDVRAEANDQWLYPPPYQAASITALVRVYSKGTASESTETIAATDYDLDEYERPYGIYYDDGFTAGGWYRITAKWGYGTPPAEIVQVVLEVAGNLWLGAQGGQFSDVVGVEGGGAVGYQRAFTNRQREVILAVRRKYGVMGMA